MAKSDRFDIGKIRVHPPTSADDLLRQIEAGIEERLKMTVQADWRQAQRERQAKYNIRGGGAPGTLAEGQAMIEELIRQRFMVTTFKNAGQIEQAQAAVTLAIEAGRQANELLQALGGAKVAILFKSGGPFLYTSSEPSDYSRLIGAGSKGKAVWSMGWGPDRHPSYIPFTPTEERILRHAAVSSSWLREVWLISNEPIASGFRVDD